MHHLPVICTPVIVLCMLAAAASTAGCFGHREDPTTSFVIRAWNLTGTDVVVDYRTRDSPNRHGEPALGEESNGGSLVIPCRNADGGKQWLNVTVYEDGPDYLDTKVLAGPKLWDDLKCPAIYRFRLEKDWTMTLTLEWGKSD